MSDCSKTRVGGQDQSLGESLFEWIFCYLRHLSKSLINQMDIFLGYPQTVGSHVLPNTLHPPFETGRCRPEEGSDFDLPIRFSTLETKYSVAQEIASIDNRWQCSLKTNNSSSALRRRIVLLKAFLARLKGQMIYSAIWNG